jgi:predicted nucleotidyltransferase
MARRSVRGDMLRQALAQEAARIIVEHGVDDYLMAKRKAAERFGVTDHAVLPKNTEIEEALATHHRLFGAASHEDELAGLRRHALEAMRLLGDFEPRLVGPVLSGNASAHSPVQLHLFADTPEAVVLRLMDAGVRYRVGQRRIKVLREAAEAFPTVEFTSGGAEVEAVVFPRDGIRQSPFGPVDGRPMRRATRQEVEALLAAAEDGSGTAPGRVPSP